MLAILEKLGLKSDLKIYVKKTLWGYYWRDGMNFDYTKDVEKFLREENEKTQKVEDLFAEIEGRKPNKCDNKKLVSSEIIRYHFYFQPDKTADIIFERSKE